jgi:hypothetical protein
MSESKGVLLLSACFILLLTIMGLAYAQESPISITTDKTTYSPGGTVYVTVTVTGNGESGAAGITVEIVPVPSPGPLFPTVEGTVPVNGGTIALTLPNNAAPGHYDVGVLVTENGAFTLDPIVGITVTKPTPVPESPSVLGLLLPALLAGVYVLRRKS